MVDLQKFHADVQRIKKHNRMDNNGSYNASQVCKKVGDLFESLNSGLGDLPHSVIEYWQDKFVQNSSDPMHEPSDKNLEWLETALSFLDGEVQYEENFTQKDWVALRELVGYEAEELPIETLSALMTILVEKKAL